MFINLRYIDVFAEWSREYPKANVSVCVDILKPEFKKKGWNLVYEQGKSDMNKGAIKIYPALETET